MTTATGLLGLDKLPDYDSLRQIPPQKWSVKRSAINQSPLPLAPTANRHVYAIPVEIWRTIFHHLLTSIYDKPRFPLRRDERDSNFNSARPRLSSSSSKKSLGKEEGASAAGESVAHDTCKHRENKPPSFHLELLTLGQVCSLWRAITFVTPILWSTIQVYNPTPSCLHYVRHWLWQSSKFMKPEPLSLSLRCDSRYLWTMRDVGATQITQTILDLYLENLTRWKSITLECYFKEEYAPLIEAPFHKAKLLETADIKSYSVRDDLNIKLWDVIFTSPVRRFLWHGKTFPSIETTPWKQFTHVSLPGGYFDTYRDLLPLLSKSTRLEYLSIETFMASDFWIDTTKYKDMTPYRFPRLRTLCLRGCTLDSGLFLQHITAPSLDSLLIKQRDTHTPLNPQLFCSFLERSNCHLKALHLDLVTTHAKDADEVILEYLKSPFLARMQRVGLSGECLGDKVLEALTLGSSPIGDDVGGGGGGEKTGLLPLVREMTLQKCKPSKDGLIADLLRSRIKLVCVKKKRSGLGKGVKKKKSRASQESGLTSSSASASSLSLLSAYSSSSEKRVVFDGRSLEFFSLTFCASDTYDEHPVDAAALWEMFQAGLKGAQRS
ncbi:hypothetical protein AX16_008589 [Volvariella volvacea WC 439]|nr:hypothetical protein AX16_008589 [Volvariella volvacea WC 439]